MCENDKEKKCIFTWVIKEGIGSLVVKTVYKMRTDVAQCNLKLYKSLHLSST